ncbi:unnamed protein product, partial [Pylaiella littoralis]
HILRSSVSGGFSLFDVIVAFSKTRERERVSESARARAREREREREESRHWGHTAICRTHRPGEMSASTATSPNSNPRINASASEAKPTEEDIRHVFRCEMGLEFEPRGSYKKRRQTTYR